MAVPTAIVLWSTPGFAQGSDELGTYRGPSYGANYESPQSGAFEVRFGPYRPNVDNEFGDAGPYDRAFGDSTRFLVGLEFDWQALRIPALGSLGPGFGIGHSRSSGPARFTDTGEESGQDSTLSIFPMYAVAVLRVDTLMRNARIPLVPYGKLGMGFVLWEAGSGGETAEIDGIEGQGAELGWQFAIGAMLLLDFLEPSAATDMDVATGVNHSYLFFELYSSDVDSFGSGLQVGTTTWMTGLAFEF
jgi:hypothetical protein